MSQTMSDRVKGLQTFRGNQLAEEQMLERRLRDKPEFMKLNTESQSEVIREDREKLIEEQDKQFNEILQNIKSDFPEYERNIGIEVFKESTGLTDLIQVAEKLDISTDLAYKLLSQETENYQFTQDNISKDTPANKMILRILSRLPRFQDLPEDTKYNIFELIKPKVIDDSGYLKAMITDLEKPRMLQKNLVFQDIFED